MNHEAQRDSRAWKLISFLFDEHKEYRILLFDFILHCSNGEMKWNLTFCFNVSNNLNLLFDSTNCYTCLLICLRGWIIIRSYILVSLFLCNNTQHPSSCQNEFHLSTSLKMSELLLFEWLKVSSRKLFSGFKEICDSPDIQQEDTTC